MEKNPTNFLELVTSDEETNNLNDSDTEDRTETPIIGKECCSWDSRSLSVTLTHENTPYLFLSAEEIVDQNRNTFSESVTTTGFTMTSGKKNNNLNTKVHYYYVIYSSWSFLSCHCTESPMENPAENTLVTDTELLSEKAEREEDGTFQWPHI